MRQVNDLLRKYKKVWFRLPDEQSKKDFMDEILSIDPESRFTAEKLGSYMACDREGQLSHITCLVWYNSFSKKYPKFRRIPKVDYKKLHNGDDDYIMKVCDLTPAGFTVGDVLSDR